MKTIRKPLLFIALAYLLVSFLPHSVQAQDGKTIIGTQSAFAEIWGNGVFLTLNYDFRFVGEDGFGMRMGIGGLKLKNIETGPLEIEELNYLSIPVGFNYLIGKNNRFFEIGLGTTYFKQPEYEKFLGFINLGFRYQPAKGYTFRANWTPVFGDEIVSYEFAGDSGFYNFWPLFGGVSFGYAF